ncbi:MAG: EamA family transporter RarD, partial [Caldilineae bacterium]
PFNAARGVGFALIWMALILYTAESIVHVRRRRAVLAAVPISAD